MSEKCKQKTADGEDCSKDAKMNGLCALHHNLNSQKQYLTHNGPTKECSSRNHRASASKYSKEKVPIDHFFKDDKSINNLYKTCLDCRTYARDAKTKQIQKFLNLKKSDDPNVMICQSNYHDVEGISIYPRNEVPKELFLQRLDDPSSICKTCSDCREYDRLIHANALAKRLEIIEDEGQFYCPFCQKGKDNKERAINLDGTESSICVSCKPLKEIYNKQSVEKHRNALRDLKYEFILKNQASCPCCNSIFLKPDEEINPLIIIELKIIENDGKHYVTYKNETYLVNYFLTNFSHLLEIRILDFDHLTENEQRERDLLTSDEKFIPKKGPVSRMSSMYEKRKEAKKCQLICCRCHITVTIDRERGDYVPSTARLIKRNYVNDFKKSGCSICGFYDENLLRFLDLDHIDPTTKIADISYMINDKECSLQQIKDECPKTRVMCKFCHKIHTDWQRKEGII